MAEVPAFRVTDYTTVDKATAAALDNEVHRLMGLGLGWEPDGEAKAFVSNGTHPHFVQTMAIHLTSADVLPPSEPR